MYRKMLKAIFRNFWRLCRNTLAIIGAVMVFGAISRDDFYTVELHTAAPEGIGAPLLIGFMLLIPALIHILRSEA